MSSSFAMAKDVPGPQEHFDLGGSEESLERLKQYTRDYGDFFRVYSPHRASYTYVVNQPDAIKRVLLTNHRNYVKGVGTDQISILLGRGIMTSSGEYWHRQRRMLQPAFHHRIVGQFGEMLHSVTEAYARRWAEQARTGEPVNITQAASELTLDINLRTIFGTDLPLIHERFGANPFAIVHTESNRDLKFAYRLRSLAGIVRELIARRRANPQEQHFDFFGMALAAQDKETGEVMNEKQLIDEVLTLVVAGHETTASALTWTWYQLGRHPHIQEALAASARALPDGRALSFDELEAWTLGQQVMKETLRLCPPGWVMSRRALQADVLNGFPIAADTDVFISPYFVHRHPEHWTDPETFDPGRFNEAADAARNRFAYIPFGVGPRHCIGEGLAKYEMTTHLAHMARRFRMTPVNTEPPHIEARINYRLRSDLMMTLEARPA
ncbi:MAG: cytochrome P450 [Proteobacteria bacterium]|nr:cytochrome P450 [Pseudomonadota bacterium]